MPPRLITETTEFKRGREREQLHARFCMSSGFFVLPSYDYSGGDDDKPPRLQGDTEAFALPDLALFRGGEGHWEEVKSKSQANHRRTRYSCEHGINATNYEHYLRVQAVTGSCVYLVIYEEDTGLVLISSLRDLGGPRMGRVHGNRGPLMANWLRSRFWVWGRFTDNQVEAIVPPYRSPACPETCKEGSNLRGGNWTAEGF